MLEFHGDMTGEYKKLGERPLRSSPNFQTSFWLGRIFHQHRHAFSKREIWEDWLSARHCKEKYPKLNK